MKRLYIASLLIGSFICMSNAFALRTVDLKEGVTEFVEVSGKDLNAIVFPDEVKVFTKSENLEVKIQEKRVFIAFKQDMETGSFAKSPEQLYFLTDNRTYSMVLIPKGIPAETVIAKIETISDKDEALNWEKEQPYVSVIKNLMKAMYTNSPPNGYEVNKIDDSRDVSKWKGITQSLQRKYSGATFTGEVYVLTNDSNKIVRFSEQEFYQKGVIAVSIDSHELQPDEKTSIYLVKNLVVKDDRDIGIFDVLSQ